MVVFRLSIKDLISEIGYSIPLSNLPLLLNWLWLGVRASNVIGPTTLTGRFPNGLPASYQSNDVIVVNDLLIGLKRTVNTSPHSPTTRPSEKVGANLFNNRTYLILVDYYSDFIEIDILTSTTSEE